MSAMPNPCIGRGSARLPILCGNFGVSDVGLFIVVPGPGRVEVEN